MHISQKDAVCPKRCEGRVGGALRGNGDRAAILSRRGEEATASGYGAGGAGGLRAFVGPRGSRQPRKHGVAGSCESVGPRAAARERSIASGCRSLRLRTGAGMGGDRRRLREHSATGGHESVGPQTAAKARGCRRPRKRGAARRRGARKLRAAMGYPIMSAGRSGEQGWGWLRRAGYAGDLASMLSARRLPGPSAHNVARKR